MPPLCCGEDVLHSSHSWRGIEGRGEGGKGRVMFSLTPAWRGPRAGGPRIRTCAFGRCRSARCRTPAGTGTAAPGADEPVTRHKDTEYGAVHTSTRDKGQLLVVLTRVNK